MLRAYLFVADFWYYFHVYVQSISVIVVSVLYFFAFTIIIILGTWIMLGMFLEPEKVAPFATAVVSFVAHIASLFSRMRQFVYECKIRLKHSIEDFEENKG